MSYPHLHPSALASVHESAECRIRRIRADRWIGYARAQATLISLEELLAFPKRLRMPNALLVGPTNNGKTMILDKFRRAHPPIEASDRPDGIAQVPVLKVQMPPGPDERRFFGAILEVLAVPCSASDPICKRQALALRWMRLTNVRILMLDEVHNLLSGTSLQQRRLLNLLRWLGNELQIPLIAAGTAEALRAVQSDDQLANRFQPIALPPWEDGTDFRRLLATLEAILPLKRPSHLALDPLAEIILTRSEGILGEMVTLISSAAVEAIEGGLEEITVKLLEHGSYIAPMERRRVAV